MTKIPASISQLAKYGLDYVSLISSNRSRSRPVVTEQMDAGLLPVEKILFGEEVNKVRVELITSLDDRFDANIPDIEKSEEQRQLEYRIARDRKILDKLQEINTKIKTDEYTKRVVLQTGLITFSAKRYLDSEFSEEYEEYDEPLLQIPISGISFEYNRNGASVDVNLPENYVEVLIGAIKNYLPQNYYDIIFKFIADSEAEGQTSLLLSDDFVSNLWSTIRVQLDRAGARSICDSPNFDMSFIRITNKTNYFLAEDLKAIAEFDDEELLETSLGSWVSDDDMTIEQAVSDNGSTEIFFPFDYDKYQMKVLGISANKAVIVEGPPGTGKSQTISNLLVHLAATGKRVLFASQKDQAIRGVKDKLKTLDIPFLYGYIPDKTSKLYTEADEKDGAANTLAALNRDFRKNKVGDLKEPLVLLSKRTNLFVESSEIERSIYSLYEERRSLNYLDQFYPYEIDLSWLKQCVEIQEYVKSLEKETSTYESKHSKFISAASSRFANLEIDYRETIASLENVKTYFKSNFPERSGRIAGKVNDLKLKKSLREYGKNVLQEIYIEIEKILFANKTKSARLHMLERFARYFQYSNNKQLIGVYRTSLAEALATKNISASNFEELKKTAYSKIGLEKFFEDLTRYDEITNKIDDLSLYSANDLNREIKDIRKFYRTNTLNYVRNRILTRVSEINDSKSLKATLAQVARSLTKSKKANKTFDRLKHNSENFEAMSKVLPIWMMSLDDVSRIVPLEMNVFDYVIIDEASQCNFAYAFPAMFRAKHTIFFGDTLQMRDDNIMFKSNDQLAAIAKKHKIPEVYQIKAEEDTVKSVMDIAHLNGFKTTTLKYHYRSPNELIGFSNNSFYEPIGRKLEAINDNIVPYKDTGRVLLNHLVKPIDAEELSDKTNIAEVKRIQELIGEIKSDPVLKEKSIAILAFFNEQAELIREAVKDEDIKVSVIDGIQGDERDIIIYSFVIKDPEDKRRYITLTGEGGEIRKDIAAGRVNVAFSRARLQVHCVTSLPTELWPDGIWIKKYLEYVDKYGVISRRHSVAKQQFDSIFEKEVYESLSRSLDANEFTLETQKESLGFLIDLVVSSNGKKLAIECDGPTHFKDEGGQIYVESDWERQGMLEAAGWNFYRISYYDWINDQLSEIETLVNYINSYFRGRKDPKATSIFKELEAKAVMPEKSLKAMYVADFSDEPVDHSQPDYRLATKIDESPKNFGVGNKEINQAEFEAYLQGRTGGVINIRYQSQRTNSSKHWRSINMLKYDSTYIYAESIGRSYPIRYRRDRVVEFR